MRLEVILPKVPEGLWTVLAVLDSGPFQILAVTDRRNAARNPIPQPIEAQQLMRQTNFGTLRDGIWGCISSDRYCKNLNWTCSD